MRELKERILDFYFERKGLVHILLLILSISSFYMLSFVDKTEIKKYVYHAKDVDFKGGNIFNTSKSSSIFKGKEKGWKKKVSEFKSSQRELSEKLLKFNDKLIALERQNQELKSRLENTINKEKSKKESDSVSLSEASPVRSSFQGHFPKYSRVSPIKALPKKRVKKARVSKRIQSEVITFPVPDKRSIEVPSVVLPVGSYVKGVLLTGVEAPEGKTYPVLVQLDHAFVTPNDFNGEKRIDLAGCFMILKAQGDLSTERVQMQADSLSCTSEKGEMFERKVNGFSVDNKDNSFAVSGVVRSKRDRLAYMSFISSIVEGIGGAIQASQTTRQVNPLGGSQSVLTGDSTKYLIAGGVGNAASKVTSWYLKQAENLLPTIGIGSGDKVWIVMGSSVKIPRQFFKKGENRNEKRHDSIYQNILH